MVASSHEARRAAELIQSITWSVESDAKRELAVLASIREAGAKQSDDTLRTFRQRAHADGVRELKSKSNALKLSIQSHGIRQQSLYEPLIT